MLLGLPTASLLPRKAPFFVSVTPPGDSNCFAFNRNCSCQNSYLSSWLNQYLKKSLSWNSTEGLKGMATSALQWDPATNTLQVYEYKIKYERKDVILPHSKPPPKPNIEAFESNNCSLRPQCGLRSDVRLFKRLQVLNIFNFNWFANVLVVGTVYLLVLACTCLYLLVLTSTY